jgi:hypothetical protein
MIGPPGSGFIIKYNTKFKFLRPKIVSLWVSYKKKRRKHFFAIHKVTEERSIPQIRIRAKMSRIPNTESEYLFLLIRNPRQA